MLWIQLELSTCTTTFERTKQFHHKANAERQRNDRQVSMSNAEDGDFSKINAAISIDI